jgi:hypothetical protein
MFALWVFFSLFPLAFITFLRIHNKVLLSRLRETNTKQGNLQHLHYLTFAIYIGLNSARPGEISLKLLSGDMNMEIYAFSVEWHACNNSIKQIVRDAA